MFNTSLTDVRHAVTLVWSEVLNVKDIYPHDDFVSLGGMPLLAVHCSYLLSQHYGYKVLPKHFFEYSTVGNIALFIFRQNVESCFTETKKCAKNYCGHADCFSNMPTQKLDLSTIALNTICDEFAPVFYIHATTGTVFECQSLATHMEGKRTLYGLSYESFPLEKDSTDLRSLVTDGVQGIRNIQPHGPYYLLGRASDAILACLIAEGLEKQGSDISFLGLVDPSISKVNKAYCNGENWLSDLQSFLRVSVPETIISTEQGPLPIEEFEVERKLKVFNAARSLNQIGRTENLLNKLNVQPHCWWSSEGSSQIKNNLSSQVKQHFASSTALSLSATEIIKSEQLCGYIVQKLAILEGLEEGRYTSCC